MAGVPAKNFDDQLNQPNPFQTDANQNENEPSNSLSYANVTQKTNFPNKDQAIILPAIENSKIQEYIKAIGNIVTPKNILFSSRISNNRICIYLSSKKLVDHLIENHKTVTVNEQNLTIRRLITPAQRLVLSNVCPTIPHAELEESLKQLKFKLLSPLTFLRVGGLDAEYSHIFSFRRQTYVAPFPENSTIPDSFIINYEDTPYRIFISDDRIKCFHCKDTGHTINNCPNHTPQNVEIQTNDIEDNDITSNTINTQHTTDTPLTSQDPEIEESQEIVPPSQSIFTKPNQPKSKKESHPSKKRKTISSNEKLIVKRVGKDLLLPAKALLEKHTDPLPLNYEEFSLFFENAHGSSNPLQISRQFTEKTQELVDMIELVYPVLTDQSMKYRCTRIKTRLTKELEREQNSSQYISESDLESSQTSNSNHY